MRYLPLLLLLICLIGCSSENTAHYLSSTFEQTNTSNEQQPFNTSFSDAHYLALYFPEDLSISTYRSAQQTFTISTTWLDDTTVQLVQQGDETTYFIYSFDDTSSTLLYKGPNAPTLPIQKDAPIASYIQAPIEKTNNDDWRYMMTLQSITTEFDTYENVKVIEHHANGLIERHYLAQQFGIVRVEFTENNETTRFELSHITYE